MIIKKKSIIILLLFCLLLPLSSFAADKQYTVPEIKLTMSFPEEYVVISRESDLQDPSIQELEINVDTLHDHYLASNIYLNAIPLHKEHEIVVNIIQDEQFKQIGEFSKLPNESFDEIFEEIKKHGVESSTQYKGYELYKNDDLTFMVIETEPRQYQNIQITTLQYYTLYDDIAYNFNLHSFVGDLTPAMKTTMKSVIDTVSIGDGTAAPVQQKSTAYRLGETVGKILGLLLIVALIAGVVYFIRKKKKDPDVL